MRFGTELMRQADVLGLFTEDAPRVTRTYLSDQHKQAGEYLIGLMRRAGMTAGFGGDPDGWRDIDRRGKNVAAYVESHIEQGPVLLSAGLPVGVVTAIAGASRLRVTVTGLAGHAGTVPMGSRQDALTAASEMVLHVERYCADRKGLVGTVGKMAVLPGAINVIPQDVEFTVDVRSGDDALRRTAVAAFQSAL